MDAKVKQEIEESAAVVGEQLKRLATLCVNLGYPLKRIEYDPVRADSTETVNHLRLYYDECF